MARRILPTLLDYTQTTVSWRSLGRGQPTLNDVVAVVRQYHRDSLLAVLIRLNLALTHPRGPSQDQLVRTWLPIDQASALLRVAKQGGAAIIFHEGQVLNLIRLAFLHSPTDAGARLTAVDEFTPLTRGLLMVTDLMFPAELEEDRRAMVFSNFTRSEVFLHDESYLPNMLARCYDLFVGLPRLFHHRGHALNLSVLFSQITGLSVEEYLSLGFGVLTHYDGLNPASIGQDPIGIQRATFLQDTLLPPELRERVWNWLSLPSEDYRAALQTEWDEAPGVRWAAMRAFSDHPMIEFPDGTLVCISRRLLRERFTQGIYWIVANALQGAERDRFTAFFGDVFEEYIRRAFLRAAGTGFNPRAVYGANDRPLTDGALVTPRSLGAVECKAGRLLLRTRESGGEADLQAAVERTLDRAASQLWDGIQAGQNGDLLHLGVNPDTRYYPVIVTYEPLPAHPFALELYDRILYQNGRLKADKVRPVTLMNVRDVESLEGIIQDGEQWPDFLFRKHTERYRLLPFHNYVYERFSGQLPANEYLRARWRRLGEMIGMLLFGEPLH